MLQELVKAPEPVTELEAFSLVSLLYKAGRIDESLQVSRQFIERFGNPLSLWLDHGNMLTESQRWSELKSLAMELSLSDRCSHLWSTAKYWEGLSELFLEKSEIAEERFEEIANYPIISTATSMELVHRLRGLGQKKAARKILNQMEDVLGDDPKYWLLRCQFGAADKDLEELVLGATKAYEQDSESLDTSFYMPEKVAWIDKAISDARSKNRGNPLAGSQG